MNNKFNDKKSVQKWWIISEIFNDGIIKLKTNELIKIIKVEPISYNLKSEEEKESIIYLFKNFLISCDFDLQILIHTKKQDLSKYILKIQENLNQEKNLKISKLAKEYILFLKKLNSIKKLSNRNYYLIIKTKDYNFKEKDINVVKQALNESYYNVKEMLGRVGNSCSEVNNHLLIVELINEILK